MLGCIFSKIPIKSYFGIFLDPKTFKNRILGYIFINIHIKSDFGMYFGEGGHGIPWGGPMGSHGGPWDPRVGPWGPIGLGDPLALVDPLALGDPGPWGPIGLGDPGQFRFHWLGLRDRFHQFRFHPVPVTRFLIRTVLFM